MKKCKYAGDPSDEYCKTCDGVNMMIDGREVPCTECAGYEAGVAEVTEPINEVEVTPEPEPLPEGFMNKPEPVKEEPVKETKKQSTKSATKANNKPVKVDMENTIPEVVEPVKTACSALNNVSCTLLRYMSGATIEHNGTYYKFECCEERKLPEGLTSEQVQEEREKLWAHLNSQVDAQIEDVIHG